MNTLVKILRIVSPIVAVTLLIVQVIVSNQLATLGKHMEQLDMAVSREQDVRETLETQVASASSLLAIRERAIAEGFHEPKPNQIVALSPDSVAFGVTGTHPTQAMLP